MTPKPSLEESYALIRQAMKDQGVTYVSLSKDLNFREEKISTAVRVSSGVTPTTIKIRQRVAAALGLDPFEVWSEEYMHYVGRKAYESMPYRVKSTGEMSKEDFEKMPPRMRVRALCKDKGIDLTYLQEKYKVTYRVLTAAIYGAKNSDPLRKKIAKELEAELADIWPDLYSHHVVPSDYMVKKAAKNPDMDNFFGLGNML